MKFNIIVAVWGDQYVNCFCDVTLPSLRVRSEERNNIESSDWNFLVYTPMGYHAKISAILSADFPFSKYEFFDYNPQPEQTDYQAMSHAHYLAAVKTIQDKALAIVVPPDGVFSAGALSYIAKVCGTGKRALMINGPRLREVNVLSELKDIFLSNTVLESRKLAGILLEHIHPEWHRYHWSSSNFSTLPYALMWDAPNGWLCRNFHLHPLVIDLSMQKAMEYLLLDTIDTEFVGRAIGIWDDIHIVQDSDELLMCTLTPDDVWYSHPASGPASIEAVNRTAYEPNNVNALHRWFITKATKIHTENLTPEWRKIEEETGHLVFEALSGHNRKGSHSKQPEEIEMSQNDELVTYEAMAEHTYPSPGTDRYNNTIEDNIRISEGTQLQGSCYVGRFTELNGVTLYPLTKVGRYCSIAKNAALGASDHPISGVTSSVLVPNIMKELKFVGADIGHDVWVGTNATVLAGVTIGHGAVVGANALVTKDVRPYAIVVGQPAREIRRRFPDDVCQALLVSRWWELPHETIKDLPMDNVRATLRRVVELRRDAANIEPEAIEHLERWLTESDITSPD